MSKVSKKATSSKNTARTIGKKSQSKQKTKQQHHPAPTKEDCIASAAECKYRKEWSKKDNRCYHHAVKNKWLPECTAHMPKRMPALRFRIEYTKEECVADALGYKYKADWKRKGDGYYHCAERNEWFPECTAHMSTKKPNLIKKPPTKEECMASAAKSLHRTEWFEADGRCYAHAKRLGCFDECTAHMKIKEPPPVARVVPIQGLYTFEECMASAAKYTNRSDWIRYAARYVRSAKAQGFRDLCTAHMPIKEPTPPKPKPKPTYDECMASAARFTGVSLWRFGDSRCHGEAFARGWRDSCCAHMVNYKKIDQISA